MKPTVAIVGASRDPHRFGNISVRAHLQQGFEVFPVNPYAELIEGLPCYATLADLPTDELDRVSIYLPPEKTCALLDELTEITTNEIWLNPGSADAAVRTRAAELNLAVIDGCSIIDIGVSPDAV